MTEQILPVFETHGHPGAAFNEGAPGGHLPQRGLLAE
jgi:hypothetical protein